MTYQNVAQLADEGEVKNRISQLVDRNHQFSYYCITFTDSSNTRGSDRSIVNDGLLVDVANLMVALIGTQLFVSKTNKDRLEVILPGMPKENAIKTAGQLRDQLESQFCARLPGLLLAVGLATHPTDTDAKLGVRHLAITGADEATKLGMNRIFAAISTEERNQAQ